MVNKARRIEAGYDKVLTHGLGHGVGRDVHELPAWGGARSSSGPCGPRAGIYLEGWEAFDRGLSS